MTVYDAHTCMNQLSVNRLVYLCPPPGAGSVERKEKSKRVWTQTSPAMIVIRMRKLHHLHPWILQRRMPPFDLWLLVVLQHPDEVIPDSIVAWPAVDQEAPPGITGVGAVVLEVRGANVDDVAVAVGGVEHDNLREGLDILEEGFMDGDGLGGHGWLVWGRRGGKENRVCYMGR